MKTVDTKRKLILHIWMKESKLLLTNIFNSFEIDIMIIEDKNRDISIGVFHSSSSLLLRLQRFWQVLGN